jgi:DNA primase
LEYLLDRAAAGRDFGRDDNRRQFLEEMLAVAARIPDAAARDQFADRIAHKARITEEVVRAEIRKAAVNRRTAVTTRELPSFGQLKSAEKALIWGLIHATGHALEALAGLDEGDLEGLAGRDILEVARSLHEPTASFPAALLQRLSTVDAQLVSSIAAEATAPARVVDCAHDLKRLRWERERAKLRREVEELQKAGADLYGEEINDLSRRLLEISNRIEETAYIWQRKKN